MEAQLYTWTPWIPKAWSQRLKHRIIGKEKKAGMKEEYRRKKRNELFNLKKWPFSEMWICYRNGIWVRCCHWYCPPIAYNVVHPSSCRYEDEINKHTAAENEFMAVKKVRWLIKETGFSAEEEKWPCMCEVTPEKCRCSQRGMVWSRELTWFHVVNGLFRM